jgi:hypothetical protein
MCNYDLKLVDSSRLLADILVKDIGNEPDRFAEMIGIAFRDEYPVSMRAARIVALCAEQHIELINPYVFQIVESIGEIKVDGVKRGFLKILAELPLVLDEQSLGIITDLAFNWLNDPKQAIAIRYYSIDILYKVAAIYPEIGVELSALLKSLADDSSSGLKSKSKKVLKYLKRMSY